MSSSTTPSSSSGGIGFLGALAILFIALKLTGYIDWSWWWVLAPIWAPLPLVAVGGVAYVSCSLVSSALTHRKNSRTGKSS